MALTTTAKVKEVLAFTAETHDDVIDAIVDAVSMAIAQHCRRFDVQTGESLLERHVDRVEYPVGGLTYVQVMCWPIESVSEIKQAADRDFDSVDALTENEDYWIDPHVGGRIRHLLGEFYAGYGTVRVTYTGGYYTGSGETPEGAIVLPSDLAWAARQQAVHEFQHRTQFGERQISVGDMTVAQVKDGLLEVVKQKLAPYVYWG